MTKEQIQEMRNKEMTYQQIADELGVSKQRVHQIYKDYGSMQRNIIRRVRKLYGNRCVICESNRRLCVHHLDGVRKNNEMTNLTLLCKHHHLEAHIEERKRFGLHKKEKMFGRNKRKERIIRKCAKQGCPNSFEIIPTYKKKYCSSICAGSVNTRVKVACLVCRKVKERPHAWILRGTKYCSIKCRNRGNRKYEDKYHRYARRKMSEYYWANPKKYKKIAHKYYLKRLKKLSPESGLRERTNKGKIITWIKNKLRRGR